MILYSLCCENDHQFEGWFPSSLAYEKQRNAKLISCPHCYSAKVEKALMAPNIAPNLDKGEKQRKMYEFVQNMKNNAENVGDKFSETALKIHYGEIEEKSIYGKATHEQAQELIQEGVNFLPLPHLPESFN